MDFGAEIADRAYREIPTGALRPRNDISGSAFDRTIHYNLTFGICRKWYIILHSEKPWDRPRLR